MKLLFTHYELGASKQFQTNLAMAPYQTCVQMSGLESKLMAPMNISLSFKRRKEIRAKGANMIFPASSAAYQA